MQARLSPRTWDCGQKQRHLYLQQRGEESRKKNISVNRRITTGHQRSVRHKENFSVCVCAKINVEQLHSVFRQKARERCERSLYASQEQYYLVGYQTKSPDYKEILRDESCSNLFLHPTHPILILSSIFPSDKWLQSDELFSSFKKKGNRAFAYVNRFAGTNHELEFVELPFSAFSHFAFFVILVAEISWAESFCLGNNSSHRKLFV